MPGMETIEGHEPIPVSVSAGRQTGSAAMSRYHPHVFDRAGAVRYLIVWDLQWQVIECVRLEPRTALARALAEKLDRLAKDGWRAEGTAEFGFVFLERRNERRLLMLTTRDPRATIEQSFSPFRG
jgi:hypothetical protein